MLCSKGGGKNYYSIISQCCIDIFTSRVNVFTLHYIHILLFGV